MLRVRSSASNATSTSITKTKKHFSCEIGRAVSQHDLDHQLVTSRTNSQSFYRGADCATEWVSIHGMFNAGCVLFFLGGPPSPRGGLISARFTRLTQVGKSADYQLVSPADLPTKVT